MLVLTATATKDTRDFIIDNLCLYNPVLLSATPERTNIRYSVVRIPLRDPKAFLKPIFKDITSNLYSVKHSLIFCRLMGDFRRIYQCFNQTFKNRFHSYSGGPFARYHFKTDDVVKEILLSDFTNENGIDRALIAAIAFERYCYSLWFTGSSRRPFSRGWACTTRWFTKRGSVSNISKEFKLKKHLESSTIIFKKMKRFVIVFCYLRNLERKNRV